MTTPTFKQPPNAIADEIDAMMVRLEDISREILGIEEVHA